MKVKIAITALLLVAVVLVMALMLPANAPAQLEGITNLNGLHLTQSSFGTATPQVMIQNGSDGISFEIRNADATPVFYVDKDGAATYSGFSSGGGAVSGAVGVTAPTAVATATPALMVNNLGAGNNLLELRDAATPVFSVSNSGAVSGQVLKYATSGTQLVCGTQTITESAAVSHGLTTPLYAVCSLAEDPTGDAQTCSTIKASSVVTVSVWQSAATPTANSAGASVNWCVIGTP